MTCGSNGISFMFGVLFTILCMFFLIYIYGGFNNQSPYDSVNITIIDKEESDQTVYSDLKHIYTTNKFEWKRLEINHTYQCVSVYQIGISNCTEVKS